MSTDSCHRVDVDAVAQWFLQLCISCCSLFFRSPMPGKWNVPPTITALARIRTLAIGHRPRHFDFDLVASLWPGTSRRRVQHKERKQRAKETKAEGPMLEVGQGEEDWSFLVGFRSEGNDSSGSLSTVFSSSHRGSDSDCDCDPDSDSDSE